MPHSYAGMWGACYSMFFMHSCFLVMHFLSPHPDLCFYNSLLLLLSSLMLVHIIRWKQKGNYQVDPFNNALQVFIKKNNALQFAPSTFPLLSSCLDTPLHNWQFCRKDISECQETLQTLFTWYKTDSSQSHIRIMKFRKQNFQRVADSKTHPGCAIKDVVSEYRKSERETQVGLTATIL